MCELRSRAPVPSESFSDSLYHDLRDLDECELVLLQSTWANLLLSDSIRSDLIRSDSAGDVFQSMRKVLIDLRPIRFKTQEFSGSDEVPSFLFKCLYDTVMKAGIAAIVRGTRLDSHDQIESEQSETPLPISKEKLDSHNQIESEQSETPLPISREKLDSHDQIESEQSGTSLPIPREKLDSHDQIEFEQSRASLPIPKEKLAFHYQIESEQSETPLPIPKEKLDFHYQIKSEQSGTPLPIPGEKLDSHYRKSTTKIKRGLSGFVNGLRTSAFPDTGAAENVVSAAFAEERQLEIKNNPSNFRLGNSRVTQSIGKEVSFALVKSQDRITFSSVNADNYFVSKGTVRMRWAFAEEATKPFDIICHVLPICIYDLILGGKFLVATETLAKYRRRVTQCVFTSVNMLHFNLLYDGHQTLEVEGRLGDHLTCAIADTGAERNVMDL